MVIIGVKSNSTIGFNGNFRVNFVNILLALKETVANNKNLHGHKFKEIVELFQTYGATRIQAFYRGHIKNWRFKIMNQKCYQKIKDNILLYYKNWYKITLHNINNKKYLLRKLYVWNKYVKKMKKIREFFRVTYWPFFVWRRYTNRKATAREKVKFLVTRIYPTYLQLHVFHAWKYYIQSIINSNNITIKYIQIKNLKLIKISFKWLLRWTKRRKGLRKAWYRSGLLSHHAQMFELKNFYFYILRCYLFYRKEIRKRVSYYSIQTRIQLFQSKPIIKEITLGEKKQKFKIKRRMEKLRMNDDKNFLKERHGTMWNPSSLSNNNVLTDGLGISPRDRKVSMSPNINVSSPNLNSISPTARQSSNRLSIMSSMLPGQSNINISLSQQLYNHTNHSFQWKLSLPNYDIDSDNEDDIDVPSIVMKTYSDSPYINELVKPKDIDFLYDFKLKYLIQLYPMHQGK